VEIEYLQAACIPIKQGVLNKKLVQGFKEVEPLLPLNKLIDKKGLPIQFVIESLWNRYNKEISSYQWPFTSYLQLYYAYSMKVT